MKVTPEYEAFQKEAALVAEQMALGATIVSKTNYARQGRYIQLFFNLSIAFERACKLILVVDDKLNNGGLNPPDLKRYGHNLIELFKDAEKIADTLELNEIAIKPETERVPKNWAQV